MLIRPQSGPFFWPGLFGSNTLEACAILQKDKDPEHGCYQCRRNASRRKREMKREDVIKLRRQQCQRQRQPDQVNREACLGYRKK